MPACSACNSNASFDENVVKTVLTLMTNHPDFVAGRKPGGSAHRAMARDARLRALIESHTQNGNFVLSGQLLCSFEQVFRKAVQGLYFAVYQRVVEAARVTPLYIADQRLVTTDDFVAMLRPNPLRDITDAPLPELKPSGWMAREPVIFVDFAPISPEQSNQQVIRRVFRLIRETPVDWVHYQPGVFTFGFVKHADGRAVCVLQLWETLLVAVAAPWPDDRGPLRRGRRNPFSRER